VSAPDLEPLLTELVASGASGPQVALRYTAELLRHGLSPDEAASAAYDRLIRPWEGRTVQSDLQGAVNFAAGTHRERLASRFATALEIARALGLRGEPWAAYMLGCSPKKQAAPGERAPKQAIAAWRSMTSESAAEFGASVDRPPTREERGRPRDTRDRPRRREVQ